MKVLLNKVKQTQLGQGILVLSVGAIVPQAINVLFYPFLTRLYSPSEFGTFAVLNSVVSILSTVVSWRYDLAIPLAQDRETGLSLLVTSFVATLFTVLAVVGGLWVVSGQGWITLLDPGFAAYAWALPLALLGTGFTQTLTYGALWLKRFTLVARVRMVQSLGQGLVQVAGGVLGMGTSGLLLGFVLGRYLGLVPMVLALRIPREVFIPRKWLSTAFRYRKFPLYNTWTALLDAIGQQFPTVLMAKLFSTEEAGQFSLAIRFLGLPSLLIGHGLAQAFYPWAAERADKSEYFQKRIEKLSGALLIISFGLFGTIAVVAPSLFGWVFGEAWRLAGDYVRYLVPWLMLNFISSPLSTIVLVKGKQKEGFFFTIYEASLRQMAIWLGYLNSSATLSVALFGISGALISMVYLFWELHLAGVSIKRWLNQIGFVWAIQSSIILLIICLESTLHSLFLQIISLFALGGFSSWALVRWLR